MARFNKSCHRYQVMPCSFVLDTDVSQGLYNHALGSLNFQSPSSMVVTLRDPARK